MKNPESLEQAYTAVYLPLNVIQLYSHHIYRMCVDHYSETQCCLPGIRKHIGMLKHILCN